MTSYTASRYTKDYRIYRDAIGFWLAAVDLSTGKEVFVGILEGRDRHPIFFDWYLFDLHSKKLTPTPIFPAQEAPMSPAPGPSNT